MSETHGETGKQQSRKRPFGPFRRRKKPAAKPKLPNNYAFIDSQNLNLGVQKMGWKMDWHRFREWLATEYGVTKAFMFIGYMAENESLYEQMYDHGFLVVLKPTLEVKASRMENYVAPTPTAWPQTDSKDEKAEKMVVKGNIDADLVLYAMKELPHYDKAIIVSGDGDFYGLIEYLGQQNKLLKLLTPNRRYSTLLQQFDEFVIDLNDHRNTLSYRPFHKKKPTNKKLANGNAKGLNHENHQVRSQQSTRRNS